MNLTNRLKNPWFWIGILGVVLTAMGADPEMFTSWEIVVDKCKELVGNPFMLFSVFIAVLGVFVEPTTKGITDGDFVKK